MLGGGVAFPIVRMLLGKKKFFLNIVDNPTHAHPFYKPDVLFLEISKNRTEVDPGSGREIFGRSDPTELLYGPHDLFFGGGYF